MARSLIVRLRFPFFRFYARMGDAQVDADLKHEDAAIRRSTLDQLVQLGKLYLGYLTKPSSSNHTYSKYDASAAYAESEAADEQFHAAGGGESHDPS